MWSLINVTYAKNLFLKRVILKIISGIILALSLINVLFATKSFPKSSEVWVEVFHMKYPHCYPQKFTRQISEVLGKKTINHLRDCQKFIGYHEVLVKFMVQKHYQPPPPNCLVPVHNLCNDLFCDPMGGHVPPSGIRHGKYTRTHAVIHTHHNNYG